MSEKLCMFCANFKWEKPYMEMAYSMGEFMYGGATCTKGHIEENIPYDEADFRELILRAEKCLDYEPPK